MDKTRVFNADCLPAMREFPDKYFELAIVDPPYGIGEGNKKNKTRSSYTGFGDKKTWVNAKDYGGGEWDYETPSLAYFSELRRVSVNQIVWGGKDKVRRIVGENKWTKLESSTLTASRLCVSFQISTLNWLL